MIKPEKSDIKVFIKFELEEFEILKENTWDMSESFGLDRRIEMMTGKRKVSFYNWDLECLENVIGDLKTTPVTESLYAKIINGLDFIKNSKSSIE
jgi:hypothetical protein